MSRLAKAWNSTEKIKHRDGMAQKHMATSSKAKQRKGNEEIGMARQRNGVELKRGAENRKGMAM